MKRWRYDLVHISLIGIFFIILIALVMEHADEIDNWFTHDDVEELYEPPINKQR